MAAASENHPPPIAAASVILIADQRVLLVERGAGAAAGLWSLPGGHVEPGETAEAAARREVREETGIIAGELAFLGIHEVLLAGAGAKGRRYSIAVFAGPLPEAVPVAGGDARTARVVDFGELARLPLTEGAASLIGRAHVQVSAMIARQK